MDRDQVYLYSFHCDPDTNANPDADANTDCYPNPHRHSFFFAGNSSFGSSNQHSKRKYRGLYRVGISACIDGNYCELQHERQRHFGHELLA